MHRAVIDRTQHAHACCIGCFKEWGDRRTRSPIFLLLIQQTRRCTRYYKSWTSKVCYPILSHKNTRSSHFYRSTQNCTILPNGLYPKQRPVATQRRTTKSAAAVPALVLALDTTKKMSLVRAYPQPCSRDSPTFTSSAYSNQAAFGESSRRAEAADDDDDDGDNYKADSEQDSGGGKHKHTISLFLKMLPQRIPSRPQRTRGRGGREAAEEQEEAAARKASKAAKAAQKKRQQETGEEPQPTPLQDTVYKNKTLVPRDSRIPATPVYRPTTSSKEYNAATVPSQGGSDWRRSSRDEMEVDEEDRRPQGINGNPLPSHVRLDLSAFPRYVADQWATAPRRRRSPSPELDHTDRGREYARPSSPVPRRHRESTPVCTSTPDPRPRCHPPSWVDPNLDRGHARPSSPPPLPQRRYPWSVLVAGHQDPVASTSQRPLSPAPGSKRARSPAEDLRRTQAQKVNDHQGRAQIVATAIMYFRCLLATEDAFPDHTSESHLLTLAWAMARDEHKIAMDLAPDIAKLITSRTSQMRGELKTKVRGLVELTFGFESGQNKKNVRKNRQLAEDLKEDMGYAHQVNPSKAEGRKGLYKANIIQKATNLMWFGNRRAEGAMHPEIFGPALPKPTLALVLTAVECGIDEWATGIKTDVPFTSADYRSIYTDHINSMTAFEKRSAPRDILGNILTRLHNVGRFHSGSQPLVAARTTSLSTSAIDAAIREYDEDSETVTEGEFGDDDE
ncbi:hypothetical protein K438DRAFT_1819207 [Mycena galopus ATCC 62051]|nr:hypothetical protein K438DRAFT_1819207 [Mycena galopus ATCC 62051]